MTTAVMVPLSEIQTMAAAVAKSGLFGVKTPEQALALMLVAQAEGRHPALAARDYDIIQGRPAKKAEAMMRDFLESGGKVEWHQLDDDGCAATFSHPSGGTVKIDWTMKRATAAGLGGREMWKKYPRQMLRSRVVSEGIRTVCPMATSGMYVPEEVSDFVKEKNITPTSGAGENLSEEQKDKVVALFNKVTVWLNSDSVGDAVAETENAGMDADEYVYFWTFFDSKQRSAMKKETARIKAKPALLESAPPPGSPPSAEPAGSSPSGQVVGADPMPSDAELIVDVDHWIAKKKFKAAGDVASFIADEQLKTDTLARIQTAYDKAKAA